MRIRRRMSQTQPDLGGARDESSSRPSGHGGVNTPGTHLVTSHLASLPEPEGRLRHSQPWLCRDLALIGERALLGVKGPHRSEIRKSEIRWHALAPRLRRTHAVVAAATFTRPRRDAYPPWMAENPHLGRC